MIGTWKLLSTREKRENVERLLTFRRYYTFKKELNGNVQRDCHLIYIHIYFNTHKKYLTLTTDKLNLSVYYK